jgi:hypothetical protein
MNLEIAYQRRDRRVLPECPEGRTSTRGRDPNKGASQGQAPVDDKGQQEDTQKEKQTKSQLSLLQDMWLRVLTQTRYAYVQRSRGFLPEPGLSGGRGFVCFVLIPFTQPNISRGFRGWTTGRNTKRKTNGITSIYLYRP